MNTSNSRIFVTGGSGYIGRQLVRRLVDEGHEIHVLCRRRPEGEPFQTPRVKVFEGGLLDKGKIFAALQGCDHVFHVAAHARVWARDPKTFFDVNVQGTMNVLEVAHSLGTKRVVFTSTAGTLGVSNGQPLTESAVRSVDFFNEYEISKFMAEEKVQDFVRHGLDVVTVHPSRVYGPGAWTSSNPISSLIKAYVTGQWHLIPGNGKKLSSFSFIDDVVDGHLLAMENGQAGEKYILAGENADFNTFFSLLRRASEKDFLLVRVPVPLMMLFGWKEELMANWFGKEPVITRKWIRKYDHDMALSSKKAIDELGYRITPLLEGIEKTLQWLRKDCHIYF